MGLWLGSFRLGRGNKSCGWKKKQIQKEGFQDTLYFQCDHICGDNGVGRGRTPTRAPQICRHWSSKAIRCSAQGRFLWVVFMNTHQCSGCEASVCETLKKKWKKKNTTCLIKQLKYTWLKSDKPFSIESGKSDFLFSDNTWWQELAFLTYYMI